MPEQPMSIDETEAIMRIVSEAWAERLVRADLACCEVVVWPVDPAPEPRDRDDA